MQCGGECEFGGGGRDKPEDYPYYNEIKAEIEKFEAYYLKKGVNIAEDNYMDCENLNKYHFYCKAKLALVLLEEAAAKKIDFFGYDIKKEIIWKDERFEQFRNTDLNASLGGLKRDFKEFYEKRELDEARSAVFREWSK